MSERKHDSSTIKKLIETQIDELRKSAKSGGSLYDHFRLSAEKKQLERKTQQRRRMAKERINFVRWNKSCLEHGMNTKQLHRKPLQEGTTKSDTGRPPVPGKVKIKRELSEKWFSIFELVRRLWYFNVISEWHAHSSMLSQTITDIKHASARRKLLEDNSLAIISKGLKRTILKRREAKKHDQVAMIKVILKAVGKGNQIRHACCKLLKCVIRIQQRYRRLRVRNFARISLYHRQWLRIECNVRQVDWFEVAKVLRRLPHESSAYQFHPYEVFRELPLAYSPFPVDPIPCIVPESFVPFSVRHAVLLQLDKRRRESHVKSLSHYESAHRFYNLEQKRYTSLSQYDYCKILDAPKKPPKPISKSNLLLDNLTVKGVIESLLTTYRLANDVTGVDIPIEERAVPHINISVPKAKKKGFRTVPKQRHPDSLQSSPTRMSVANNNKSLYVIPIAPLCENTSVSRPSFDINSNRKPAKALHLVLGFPSDLALKRFMQPIPAKTYQQTQSERIKVILKDLSTSTQQFKKQNDSESDVTEQHREPPCFLPNLVVVKPPVRCRKSIQRPSRFVECTSPTSSSPVEGIQVRNSSLRRMLPPVIDDCGVKSSSNYTPRSTSPRHHRMILNSVVTEAVDISRANPIQ